MLTFLDPLFPKQNNTITNAVVTMIDSITQERIVKTPESCCFCCA